MSRPEHRDTMLRRILGPFHTSTHRSRRRQRGVVSVEFGLLLPVFLIVIAGSAHLGRLVFARHQIASATEYAARRAVAAGTISAAELQVLVENELRRNSPCDEIEVREPVVDGEVELGLRRLEITTTCVVAPVFGSEVFDFLAPESIEATSVVPF